MQTITVRFKNAQGDREWQSTNRDFHQPPGLGDYVGLSENDWRRIVAIRHLDTKGTEVYVSEHQEPEWMHDSAPGLRFLS